jgi:hypothetical protein
MSCYVVAQSTIKAMKEKHYSQIYDIMRFCTNTSALNIKIAGYVKKRNISVKQSNMSKI